MLNNSIYSEGTHSFGSMDYEERMSMLLSNYMKSMPSAFTPSSIPQQFSSVNRQLYSIDTVPVRIAQQEEQDLIMGGSMEIGMGEADSIYGGLWEEAYGQQQKQYPGYISETALEEPMQSYLRPCLSLTTHNLDSTETEYNSLYPQSSFPEPYSFCQDVPSYSNEPSPFFDHRQITPPFPPLPKTPVTPVMNPLEITSSGYVMIPTTVHHMDGTSHIEYVPKIISYIPSDVELDMNYDNVLEATTNSRLQPQHANSPHVLTLEKNFGNNNNLNSEDDEPELVGMGLYDDPPDLIHSSFGSPEMGPIGLLNSGTGRGLVLEESFDASEKSDEEEEEDEEEDEEDDQDEDDD